MGYLPELTMFVVENNPIRRKKLDQPDTKSMLTYLKTKDAPHPSLVGAASNSPEEIMLAQKMRDASHYGILTIDIDTKKNKKEQPLSIFPLKVFFINLLSLFFFSFETNALLRSSNGFLRVFFNMYISFSELFTCVVQT